ncbi:RNA polymerase sigma factor [Pseudoalteromonas tunicata]|jgi:RNA polymerase sigma-70 factor (ECF subfamily)|uniref:RNA polymerase sigma-70 factor n=1 Tax=Pseudoalteromonas tunicata D2 TaxID=87626 RepID=A4CA68_9GAMM|nr:sigma-70 family RNA polymerase sigma factor [Pseudoalteromonas tunicata]ATC94826.1 hypothetical protein PTUN_a2329 [Pseudoalteromonas tunicata]AXT30517.1 sigma-70 family RNA polymerase sigma factor [Pseudoalteromonas tunicata]EAR28276.1 RNA polymerase sigma-70 factor [Pseudoalteromonas tunicata D2]
MKKFIDQKNTVEKMREDSCTLIKELHNGIHCDWFFWIKYEKKIFNYCFYSLTKNNHHDAEDLARDTLLKAYEKLPLANPELAILGWLIKLAKNIYFDQLRKNKTQLKYNVTYFEDDSCEGDTLFKDECNRRKLILINKEISKITTEVRQITIDHLVNDKEYKAISLDYNISEAHARKLIFTSRQKIKSAFKKQI